MISAQVAERVPRHAADPGGPLAEPRPDLALSSLLMDTVSAPEGDFHSSGSHIPHLRFRYYERLPLHGADKSPSYYDHHTA